MLDRLYHWLKAWDRRYRLADYEDARRQRNWARRPAGAAYRLESFRPTIDPASVESVLVFKPDEIGDAVCALPALYELRRALPGAKITAVVHELTQPLFARTQLCDEIIAVKPRRIHRRILLPGWRRSLRALRGRNFDVSIFLRTYPLFFSSFKRIPAEIRIHPHDPHMRSTSIYQPEISLWGEERKHQALQLMEILKPLLGREFALDELRIPEMHWNSDDRSALDLLFPRGAPDRFLVIHPFAKFETKRYPLEYWCEILLGLQKDFQLPTVVVGSSDDPTLNGVPDLIQSQGRLSLTQTAYLMSRASVVLGCEGGPSLLASALGTPTAVFFGGHSLATEWAPWGQSLILHGDVPCAPCHRQTCPGYGVACLAQLEPERIRSRLNSFLRDALR